MTRTELKAAPRSRSERRESGRLRPLDGVIMLTADGRPASGRFPDNVWVVMGSELDNIEDFFGPGADVITVGLETSSVTRSTHFCVGFDAGREHMVMNSREAYPVYVSEILRLHREGL